MNKISQAAGIPIDELIATLKQVANNSDRRAQKQQIENVRSRVSSPEISQALAEIIGSLNVPDNFGIKDPISGESYPTASKKIQDLINNLQATKQADHMNKFNFYKFSQKAPQDKKKKRGNPFRVLMGKVGKLLDHGMNKRTIVRYLMKEGTWSEEIIDKAVKIVKDYNKKQHHKPKKATAQTLIQEAPELERMKYDYSKRSTPELITSLLWLKSLDSANPNNTFEKEVEDRSGVKNMIKNIKSALKNRGMSDDQLNQL